MSKKVAEQAQRKRNYKGKRGGEERRRESRAPGSNWIAVIEVLTKEVR